MNNQLNETTTAYPANPVAPLAVTLSPSARVVLAQSITCQRSAKKALRTPVPLAPDADKPMIMTSAWRGLNGLSPVLEYHAAKFLALLGGPLVVLRQVAADIASNYHAIVEMEARQCERLAHTDPYVELASPGVPWSWPARCAVAFLVFFSLVLIGVGINTIAQVLQNSGLSGFEDPLRAYLFSLVTVGVSVGLKYLPRFFSSDKLKRAYGITIWSVGVIAGVIWALLFARTFPGMTQSATQIVAAAMTGLNEVPASHSGWWLIYCGLIAEAFIAAGCWLSVETIASRFSSRRRVPNQAHQQVLKDLKCLARAKHQVGFYLGAVRGRIEEIEQAQRALLAKVSELFGVASTACEHQREAARLFHQQ